MKYRRHSIKEDISIPKFVTFLYRELSKDYVGSGEKHNFWEMVYVDSGEIRGVVSIGRVPAQRP